MPSHAHERLGDELESPHARADDGRDAISGLWRYAAVGLGGAVLALISRTWDGTSAEIARQRDSISAQEIRIVKMEERYTNILSEIARVNIGQDKILKALEDHVKVGMAPR